MKKKGENHNESNKENELVKFSDKKARKEGKKIRNQENRRGKGGVLEDSIEILELVKKDKNSQTKCEWCCECEKCAFIFLLLSAWMPLQGTLRCTYCTLLCSTELFVHDSFCMSDSFYYHFILCASSHFTQQSYNLILHLFFCFFVNSPIYYSYSLFLQSC